MHEFANVDPQERYCTGAYDFRRDGCPDTWGWVGDLAGLGAARPGEILCPTNPLRGLEKVNDLLGRDTTDAKDGAPPQRLGQGQCGMGATGFGDTAVNTPERADFIARAFFEKGLNTNYVASWYLVRGGLKFEPSTDPLQSISQATSGGSSYKGLAMTTGPITRRVVEASRVVSSHVPLMGDGAPGDPSEAVLAMDITKDPLLDTMLTGDPEEKVYLTAGERLAESFNDGPASWDASSNRIGLMPESTPIQHQLECEASYEGCPPPTDDGTNRYWMQDTRDWYCVHGSGSKLSCNLLMADGSVTEFYDMNSDHYLNPGFPVPTDLTQAQYAAIGYRDGQIEMHPTKVFSGIFITGDVHKAVDFESPGW
jgi:prepilin-type processing-associated H-X9-DG protein